MVSQTRSEVAKAAGIEGLPGHGTVEHPTTVKRPLLPAVQPALPMTGADAADRVGLPASDPPEPDDGIPSHRMRRTFRRYSVKAIRTLVAEMDNPWPQHRLKAAELVLAYGWGKPRDQVEDGAAGELEAQAAKGPEALRAHLLAMAQELGIAPAVDVTPEAVKK